MAGIHGVPFGPWNGVESVPGASQSGYCTHNSILFPMWHRPYLALYEVRNLFLTRRVACVLTCSSKRCLSWPARLLACSLTRRNDYFTSMLHLVSAFHTGIGVFPLQQARHTSPMYFGALSYPSTAQMAYRIFEIRCSLMFSIR